MRRREQVLGVAIDVLGWDDALARISDWAAARESRTVCLCNAHSIVTANQDANFAAVIHTADLATPDGMPVTWMLRHLGHLQQQRINGPDLMWRYCAIAALRGEPIFLYGSTADTLTALQEQLRIQFPGLKIAGSHSPPFRQMTAAEDRAIIDTINASGAGTVWVGLGCPVQETWMAAHRGQINAVSVGVGAAFDYHAGTLKRAPRWMQSAGLEWLFRLGCEPVRLWKRYLVSNTLFVLGAIKQLVRRYTESRS